MRARKTWEYLVDLLGRRDVWTAIKYLIGNHQGFHLVGFNPVFQDVQCQFKQMYVYTITL